MDLTRPAIGARASDVQIERRVGKSELNRRSEVNIDLDRLARDAGAWVGSVLIGDVDGMDEENSERVSDTSGMTRSDSLATGSIVTGGEPWPMVSVVVPSVAAMPGRCK